MTETGSVALPPVIQSMQFGCQIPLKQMYLSRIDLDLMV
jgi:hypothetical protein